MFVKIMYFMLFVSNQDKSIEFYTKLGFEKKVDYPGSEGRFVTMGFKGQDVELILWKGTPLTHAGDTALSVAQNPGIIFIESKDLRKDFESLVAKGVKFIEKAPEDYDYGVRVTALDPDGYRIALRQKN